MKCLQQVEIEEQGLNVVGRKISRYLSRQLAEITLEGKVVTSFSHRELKEPVSVAVSPTSGHWIVADIGARAVLVFEPSGKLVCLFSNISCHLNFSVLQRLAILVGKEN